MKRVSIILLICCLLFSIQLFADEIKQIENDQLPVRPQKQINFSKLFKYLNRASEPSKFFFAPSSRILKSLEVLVTTGGFFGVEDNGVLFNQIGIGLGNIAEVEFSSSNISNKLTGESSTIPTSVFKVSLIPESLSDLWYMPQLSVQLRSTPWTSMAETGSKLYAPNMDSYANMSLSSLYVNSRFTTLYVVTGKDSYYGGIHFGLSLSDIRTKDSYQWIYDEVNYNLNF